MAQFTWFTLPYSCPPPAATPVPRAGVPITVFFAPDRTEGLTLVSN